MKLASCDATDLKRMGNPLWAPWRMEYILGPKEPKEQCIFCGFDRAGEDERAARLVVCVTERAAVVLNRYPFAAGHLLVVPHVHGDSLESLSPEDNDALFRLVRASTSRLGRALKAEGFNVGLNLGAAAGAGIAAHLHVHIVPRWSGDTNFMPVLADTRVVPQALDATRDHLKKFFADLDARQVG
jgi:ATP adenylyltransferase